MAAASSGDEAMLLYLASQDRPFTATTCLAAAMYAPASLHVALSLQSSGSVDAPARNANEHLPSLEKPLVMIQ